MAPKWAKKAHFGDISYNVFNRRKSSYYMLESLYFTTFSLMENLRGNAQHKLVIVVYIHNIYKNLFDRFWSYGVYTLEYCSTFEIEKPNVVDMHLTIVTHGCLHKSLFLGVRSNKDIIMNYL